MLQYMHKYMVNITVHVKYMVNITVHEQIYGQYYSACANIWSILQLINYG